MSERDGRLHRELKSLPARKAPKTLLPRVMAAVAAEEAKPWWRKAWWNWPALAQAGFVALVAALAAGSLKLGAGWASGGLSALFAARTLAESLWVVARAFWSLGGEPLQALILMMALLSAAFASALGRVFLLTPRTQQI